MLKPLGRLAWGNSGSVTVLPRGDTKKGERDGNLIVILFDKVRATWELIAATVRPPWVAPTSVGPRHLGGDRRSYCAIPLGSALSNLNIYVDIFMTILISL